MLQKNDLAKVYETVLSIPGMHEKVKLSLQISRKNLLLLNKVIIRGLTGTEGNDKSVAMLDSLPEETWLELSNIANDLLVKSGLLEVNEKLKTF